MTLTSRQPTEPNSIPRGSNQFTRRAGLIVLRVFVVFMVQFLFLEGIATAPDGCKRRGATFVVSSLAISRQSPPGRFDVIAGARCSATAVIAAADWSFQRAMRHQ